MNAMNQIAARDISLSGIENPLLFALSDYLRESLSKLDVEVVSVRADVRLTEAHLMLHACVAHSTIDMVVQGCPNEPCKILRGTLAELAIRSLKALRLPARGKWHLLIAFERALPEDGLIGFSMAFSAAGDWRGVDIHVVQRALSEMPLLRAGDVLLDEEKKPAPSQASTLFFRARLVR